MSVTGSPDGPPTYVLALHRRFRHRHALRDRHPRRPHAAPRHRRGPAGRGVHAGRGGEPDPREPAGPSALRPAHGADRQPAGRRRARHDVSAAIPAGPTTTCSSSPSSRCGIRCSAPWAARTSSATRATRPPRRAGSGRPRSTRSWRRGPPARQARRHEGPGRRRRALRRLSRHRRGLTDPHLLARDMIVEVEHPVRGPLRDRRQPHQALGLADHDRAGAAPGPASRGGPARAGLRRRRDRRPGHGRRHLTAGESALMSEPPPPSADPSGRGVACVPRPRVWRQITGAGARGIVAHCAGSWP